MKTMKTTLSALAILAITGPALAADFMTLDANADGQVSFDEYKAIAVTEGKTETLAAQEFIRIAQGDTILTEDEFFLADALAGQPYALQSTPVSETFDVETAPMAFEAIEVVETVETSPEAVEMPEAIEMIEPPVEAEEVKEDLPAPVIVEKAMDVDPVVAGEIETSIEAAPEIDVLDDLTPVEDIETAEPELETEIEPAETDVETDLDADIEADLDTAEDPIETGEIY